MSLIVSTCRASLEDLQIENHVFENIFIKRDPKMAGYWSDTDAGQGEPQSFCALFISYARGLGTIKSKSTSLKYSMPALMHTIAV